ncbi:hypothetical protein MTR_4g088880 [Medicago truncatula]|uniref:Uncharacterized protein n=1 Tax=Medicago truncatula TaxID=3880 RepID=A0A072UMR1_MEDTR|nr:hypothetical protein MTR_4g088880 [Medicago truncatula]
MVVEKKRKKKKRRGHLTRLNHIGMREILRPCKYETACFSVNVRERTKHAEKTRVGLWGQSAILKAVWDVTTSTSSSHRRRFPLLPQTTGKPFGLPSLNHHRKN